ncbi:caspase recruitment domain-containing protein 10 isoform X3 [Brienomyrus brachyistius]|uniref:caspase recruitment domain-containing protein 10 isoform X3 n=1 Tax=Brienomyrus brachyistius TaxID=42636 RepID=UPI0020B2A7E9|nr:caspase recruitment domain-containing protein 10 isoform X3 [Brienomyrus brachyistius]
MSDCMLGLGGGAQPESSSDIDEEMWDRVEGVRHKLTRILNPAKLTPFLRQCKAIDEQDEDEVLNSTQYPLRISKAGRLLDILRGRGQRGLQAFLECLEFYHPEEYTYLTGRRATQRCSMLVDEEGPEGLTQFLLLEVRKLREQLQNSRQCERRLSQRCRMAEEERGRAERRVQELRHNRLQLERMRQDWEEGSRELARLKDRHLEQAVKYSRALEEQGKASTRERELLGQLEQLKNRLMEAERKAEDSQAPPSPAPKDSSTPFCPIVIPLVPELPPIKTPREASVDTKALLDILQQDRREAAEHRHELCSTISRLQGELESTEVHRDKLAAHCEQLQAKVRTLQLDWEMEQKRSVSYFNQIMELEKERDQALRSRDSLQLEYTDCLLDKDRLRKQVIELQACLDKLQREREVEREVERERERSREENCMHCSRLCLISEDHCYQPCCSVTRSISDTSVCRSPLSDTSSRSCQKTPSRGQTSELSEGSYSNSDENLLMALEDSERDINRLSTFAFPPCVDSIHRRAHTEFDLDSWGSDNLLTGGQRQLSLSDSFSSLNSHPFSCDLNSPAPSPQPVSSPSRPDSSHPSHFPATPKRITSLADDITIIGGNHMGIFVQSVRAGSQAEQCGLQEGSELLELAPAMPGGESVPLGRCTSEVAHYSLQAWTEPSALKHQVNSKAYSQLFAQMASPSFMGADSFYVRVNLDLGTNVRSGPQPRCDDILLVTDTWYDGRYQWRCRRVDRETGELQQEASLPNYNRAQQQLLVRFRTLGLKLRDYKIKQLYKKDSERMRLVKVTGRCSHDKSVDSQLVYTLNQRQEENLIPYSLVQPVHVSSRRPVVFSPSILSHRLIERLLQPAESGLDFNTCPPEPIGPAAERRDKNVFLLDVPTDQSQGIRLESIQDVIRQDKHCLLELGVGSVEALLRQGIYPIVIHIKSKDKKARRFKKFLSGQSEEKLMEEVCQKEEFQLESLPMLHYTLQPRAWNCTEDLLVAIRNAIYSQQRAVVWVEQSRL